MALRTWRLREGCHTDAATIRALAVPRTAVCRPVALAQEQVHVSSYAGNRQLADKCIASIASALEADPSTPYYCAPGKGRDYYTAIMSLNLKLYPTSPQIISVAGGACAAICFPLPRLDRLDPLALLTSLKDLISVIRSINWNRLREGLAVTDELEVKREAFVREHEYVLYVLTIGTDPSQQGQGLGSVVMQALTTVADRQQVPMYLEASSPRSASLYARFGFKQIGSTTSRRTPEGTKDMPPAFSLMARMPAPKNTQQQQDGQSTTNSSDQTADAVDIVDVDIGAAAYKDVQQPQQQQQEQQVSRGLFSQHPMTVKANSSRNSR